MVENRDDSRGKHRLGLFDVRTWIAEIAKHIPASLEWSRADVHAISCQG